MPRNKKIKMKYTCDYCGFSKIGFKDFIKVKINNQNFIVCSTECKNQIEREPVTIYNLI